MAPTLMPIPHLVFIFVLSCVWTSTVLFGLLFRLITAPSKLFYFKQRNKEPESVRDPQLGKHGYLDLPTFDGKEIRIHYVEKGDKGKPLLLLLHGFPESWYSWRYQLKEFSNTHRVVAVDTRGYGLSDKPAGIASYSMDHLVHDTKEIINALGYKRCILAGHDWGGAITWSFAAAYPDMCEKVIVLNCPHTAAFQKSLSTSVSQFLASWYMFFFQMPYLPEFVLRSEDYKMLDATFRGRKMGVKNRENLSKEDVEVYKYFFSLPDACSSSINYYRASMQYKVVTVKPLQPITSPFLLVWGTGDGALTRPMAVMSAKYAKDFTLKFVEGASHWVQQDDPNAVNAHIRAFLD